MHTWLILGSSRFCTLPEHFVKRILIVIKKIAITRKMNLLVEKQNDFYTVFPQKTKEHARTGKPNQTKTTNKTSRKGAVRSRENKNLNQQHGHAPLISQMEVDDKGDTYPAQRNVQPQNFDFKQLGLSLEKCSCFLQDFNRWHF